MVHYSILIHFISFILFRHDDGIHGQQHDEDEDTDLSPPEVFNSTISQRSSKGAFHEPEDLLLSTDFDEMDTMASQPIPPGNLNILFTNFSI